ncbi:MAG: polysaccharide deacetylase family protein [Thermoleophilia bacterium]
MVPRRPLNASSAIKVLVLHSVIPDPPNEPYVLSPGALHVTLAWLRDRGFRALSQEEYLSVLDRGEPEWWVRRRGVGGAMLLTFDDGLRDNLVHALPVLEDLGMPGVFFVPTSAVGVAPGGSCPPDPTRLPLIGGEMLRPDDLALLLSRGMDLGSHSRTHRRLDLLSRADVEYELCGSFHDLTAIGARPLLLAYPGGYYDRAVAETARRCGYRAAFTSQIGDGGLFGIRRIPVRGDEPAWVTRLRMGTLYGPVRRVARAFPRVAGRLRHR